MNKKGVVLAKHSKIVNSTKVFNLNGNCGFKLKTGMIRTETGGKSHQRKGCTIESDLEAQLAELQLAELLARIHFRSCHWNRGGKLVRSTPHRLPPVRPKSVQGTTRSGGKREGDRGQLPRTKGPLDLKRKSAGHPRQRLSFHRKFCWKRCPAHK